MKISGTDPASLLPYRGSESGLGTRGRTARREHEIINSLSTTTGCKREHLKGYVSRLRQQPGKRERRNTGPF